MSSSGDMQENNKALETAPASLPSEVAKTFEQAFHTSQIEKGYLWIIEHMDENDPCNLLETFLERYEEQIMRLRGAVIEEYTDAFRVAMMARYLIGLSRFRMAFADKAYNHVFIETWLKERILATLLGIKPVELRRRILMSGLKPPLFLNDELSRVVPGTFLEAHMP